MTKSPLVSVIVPTYNSSQFIRACLQSIKNQTYTHIELIVVDNNSTDDTKAIAKDFTNKVYNKGPERSAQRNFGVMKAEGVYVLIIDSDMELTPEVIKACVESSKSLGCAALVIPEESFGQGFWAKCKKLERSFYLGVPWMEAARFYTREMFIEAGGYDERLVSGEDWDLSQRIGRSHTISRVEPFIMHNEGRLSLRKTLRKKYYYARQFKRYSNKHEHDQNIQQQVGLGGRYKLFFSSPLLLFANPLVGAGMIFMKTCEFICGGVGFLFSKEEI